LHCIWTNLYALGSAGNSINAKNFLQESKLKTLLKEYSNMLDKNKTLNNIHSGLEKKITKTLDIALHAMIITLILALFLTILYKLYFIFFVHMPIGDISLVVDNILFALILVELFTILYSYLTEHYIKVERVIEVGIISIVREIIFKLFELDVDKIYSVAVILVALGALLFIEKNYTIRLETQKTKN
jgi:uncharacterized membrane protein (DUF373 family)